MNRQNAPLMICTPEGVAIAPVPAAKRCGRCGEEKPLEAFNREQKKKDGLSAWCKACKSVDQTRRRNEILSLDEDWKLRRKVFARLARLVARGEIVKPSACPQCDKVVAGRELQAKFSDPGDAKSVIWRCRACALLELGKSVTRTCAWCEEPFRAQTHALRRGAGKYCSVRCRNAWMRKTAEHVHDVAKRSKAIDVYVDDRF
jgi:predicted RNA-binding Zn-ribbon protein involved in translation (DUF1610 family)